MRLRLISGVPQRSQSDNSALRALANRSPRSESRPTLTDGAPTAPVAILKPSQVVSGLGLSTAMEEALTTRVVAWMALDKPIDVAKRLRVDLNGSVHDPRQRAEIARRFWRLWDSKHDRPSLVLHKAVKPAPGQIGLFAAPAKAKAGEKLTAKQAEYLLERDLSKPSFFGPPIAKSLSEHVNLRLIGADLVLIVDDLEKGIGHKYLKRIPTGKPKPKYRYIYKLPSRAGLIADDELKAGTKIRVEHAGKEGHFEVEQHDKERGIVRLRHDESGKTAHVKHRDLKRMVESYHSKKAGGKGIGGPPLKLRPKGVQTEISTPKVAPEKPAAKPLKSVSIDDISQWSGIVGFAPSAEDAAAMASKMSKDGHEYGAIQQPAGFAIVERKKKAKVKGEAVGEATKVFMRDSSGKGIASMDAEYVVMEADKVIASHKPTENFKLHSGYPSDVQERRYEDLPGEQLKVQRISRNLEPQLVANTNPDAVNGAPVITEDGVVLGGNGRTMGMQLAHAQEPEAAAKYKAYLTAHAREFGLSAEEVGQIKSPILIRRVKAGKDTAKLRKLGRRMNESLTQGLDPRTAEVALGKNYVNRELVDVLVDQMAPDESLADYLHNSKSTTFVNALQRSGIIDEMNHDEFVGDDGLLNEDGRSRVERVLAARFIPDAKLLSKMPQTLRQNVAKSTPYLLRAESAGWDLREPLKAAVLADIDFRANFKGTTKQYLAQTTMKGADHPVDALHKDPMAGLMFDVVRNFNGSTRMPAGFRSFARRAEAAAHDKGGFAMFATAAETPTQALDRSFGITPETKKELAETKAKAKAEEKALLERAGVQSKRKTPAPQELQLSMSRSDDLRKGSDGHGESYIMSALIAELNHILSGSRNVAALENRGLSVHGGNLRRKLLDWLDYEIDHDPEMARAFGRRKITAAMIDGLIEAAVAVHAGELRKALPIGTTRQWADGKTYKKIATGRWVEESDGLRPEEMGLRLPRKGVAYEKVTECEHVTGKIAAKATNPDQLQKTAEELFRVAKQTLPQFRETIEAIGQSTGATVKHGPLKKLERAMQKVEVDYAGDVSKLKDVVRSSLSYRKITDVYKALDRIAATKGLEVANIKDRIAKPIAGGYRDILLNVKIGDHVCELQLHVDAILEAKSKAHVFYEQSRSITAKVLTDGRDRYNYLEMGKMVTLQKKSEALYGNAFRSAR